MKDLRYLGIFPIIFGIWTTIIYIFKDQAYQLLWFCNINNFLMGIAIIFRLPIFVWVGTVWLIIGTPLWLYEDILMMDFRLHAVFVHIGSSLIGLYYIKKNFVMPKWTFIACILMGSFSQVIARLFSEPEHNVNMAHMVYPTLTEVFPSYLSYNIFNYISFFILIVLILKGINRFILKRKWPTKAGH